MPDAPCTVRAKSTRRVSLPQNRCRRPWTERPSDSSPDSSPEGPQSRAQSGLCWGAAGPTLSLPRPPGSDAAPSRASPAPAASPGREVRHFPPAPCTDLGGLSVPGGTPQRKPSLMPLRFTFKFGRVTTSFKPLKFWLNKLPDLRE